MLNCKRCGYTCENKYLLKRHLTRKNPCPITFENISNDDLLKELNTTNENKKHKCMYCEKTFTDSSNRYRHQKNCKDSKTDIEILKETVSSLQQQVTDLKQHSNNITNNIQQATINNNFNITLNNFGNESYDHISDEFIKKCIMNNVSGVKSLIERIHFSDEAPENKNVRLKSSKNNLVEISNNDKWIVRDANEAMETMINKGCRILNGYYYNPDSGLLDQDINELDARIQNFLLSIIDKNNKHYFALRRRILALLIEHGNSN
jgi:hypothetical protein